MMFMKVVNSSVREGGRDGLARFLVQRFPLVVNNLLGYSKTVDYGISTLFFV